MILTRDSSLDLLAEVGVLEGMDVSGVGTTPWNELVELVMAYFNLSSYLYLSRFIHNVSLIIYELSVPLACLYHVYIHMRTV